MHNMEHRMAKLELSIDGEVVNEYQLDKEIITIGRKADNDIQIDNLSVSGYHAKVLTILNDSFIEDLDSTNGTLVYGKKITKHALVNNNSIVVGNYELKYINATADEQGDFIKTMIFQAGTGVTPSSGETALTSANTSTTDPGPAKLKLMSGENEGKELPLTKIITTVGIPEVQVAAITRRPTGYYLIVVDAGKNNKMPLVNDDEIDKQHLLVSGDVINVGGVKMGFFLI